MSYLILVLNAFTSAYAAPSVSVGELHVGEPVLFEVTDADPGARVYLVWSPLGETSPRCFPQWNDVCTELAPPMLYLTGGVADGLGTVQVEVTVPERSLPGPFGALEAWVAHAGTYAITEAVPLSIAFPDADLDGFPADVDCDDDDERAFPGQTRYYDVPRADGSFDFDCDGQSSTNPSQYSAYCQSSYIGYNWNDAIQRYEDQWQCFSEGTWRNASAVGCGEEAERITRCTGILNTGSSTAGCTMHWRVDTRACR